MGALLREGSLAHTSRTLYQRAWTQCRRWCGMMELPKWLSPDDVHKTAAQLGAFAVFLWQFGMNKRLVGNAYSTICSKLCAARWYHKTEAGYDPGVSTGHAILLCGIRRFTDHVIKQNPVSAPLLRAMLRLWTSCGPTTTYCGVEFCLRIYFYSDDLSTSSSGVSVTDIFSSSATPSSSTTMVPEYHPTGRM